MCRSNAQHRLPNRSTQLANKQKLHLPIYDMNNPPTCKCGKANNQWGGHTFQYNKINKKYAHNILQDTWEEALQLALTTAGYIRLTTKLDIEQKRTKTHNISVQPFNISIDPDQPTVDKIHIAHIPQLGQISQTVTVLHSYFFQLFRKYYIFSFGLH